MLSHAQAENGWNYGVMDEQPFLETEKSSAILHNDGPFSGTASPSTSGNVFLHDDHQRLRRMRQFDEFSFRGRSPRGKGKSR